ISSFSPAPLVRNVPGLPSTGFSQPAGCDADATSTGAAGRCSRACGPVTAGPRSPANTRGPHITARRFGLSGSASLRSVLGIVSSTVSPAFHVRAISTNPFAGATFVTSPFTFTANPSPAQNGRRSANVNFFDACGVTLTVALSPIGRSVVTSSFTPADFQSAIDGVY